MTYLSSIFLAIFFSWAFVRVKGVLRYICFVLAILFPALIWGLRSTDLGCDVNLYALPIWNYSLGLRTLDYSAVSWGHSIEFGYMLLNFLLTRVFDDIHWLLFFLAVVACVAVLATLVRTEFRNVAWMGYAYYLLMFFPRTVNIVRQGFAMAILVVAASAFLHRKWKTYVAFVCLASLFHNSALLALSFPLIYYFLRKNNSKTRQIVLSVVCLICVLAGQVLFSNFLFLNDKYAVYLDGTFKPHFTIFSLINVPFILIFYMYYSSFKKFFSFHPIELFLLIAGTLLGQLSWIVSVYMARVAQPYNYFLIFAPMMLLMWTKARKAPVLTKMAKIVCLLYALAYFWVVFYINGESSLFPYRSEIIEGFFN